MLTMAAPSLTLSSTLQHKVHPQAAGASSSSSLSKLLLPYLEKIIKFAPARRQAQLIKECKAVITWFADSYVTYSPPTPVRITRLRPPSPHAPQAPWTTLQDAQSSPFSPAVSGITALSPDIRESVTENGESRAGFESQTPPQQQERVLHRGISYRGSGGSNRLFFSNPELSSFECIDSAGDVDADYDNRFSRTPPDLPPNAILFDDGNAWFSVEHTSLILRPLLSACRSHSASLAEIAIACLQRLVGCGWVRGELRDGGANENEQMLGQVLDAVCGCAQLAEESLRLEVGVLQLLLSLVCSPLLRLHNLPLLQVFQACMKIGTKTRIPVHHQMAKAAMAQIMTAAMTRMEMNTGAVGVREAICVENLVAVLDRGAVQVQIVQTFLQSALVNGATPAEPDLVPALPMRGGKSQEELRGSAARRGKRREERRSVGMGGWVADMGDPDPPGVAYMKRSLGESGCRGGGQAGAVRADSERDFHSLKDPVLVGDVARLVDELCQVAVRDPMGVGAEVVAEKLREKVLAMEVLCHVVETAGDVFLNSQGLRGLVRDSVCFALLANANSVLTSVSQLALALFLRLLHRFRAVLKQECGKLFNLLLLWPLEDKGRAPPYQKALLVLELVEGMAVEPQLVVDLFVNYDCDVEQGSAFLGIVSNLRSIAEGAPAGTSTSLTSAEQVDLRVTAVKCLVAILRAMSQWASRQVQAEVEGGAGWGGVGGQSPQPSEATSEGSVYVNDVTASAEGGVDRSIDSISLAGSAGLGRVEDTSEASTLQMKMKYKREFQEGVALFNCTPLQGMEALVAGGKVGGEAEARAEFLKTCEGLNKGKIGEYLGENSQEATTVLSAYTQAVEFTGLDFDAAIRLFLLGFRLPGEAQQIDRIMEQFAARFCGCNPSAFVSAVTAHVLAYSVILLNTDAHNPVVKVKMTREEFIRNNRGIDDGKDLPLELLEGLYERIVREEIKLKWDGAGGGGGGGGNPTPAGNGCTNPTTVKGGRKEKEGAKRELHSADDVMMMMRQVLKEKAKKQSSSFYSASDYEIVRAMMESVWNPLLIALSLKDWTEGGGVEAAAYRLEGFKHAVDICSLLGMKERRDAFLGGMQRLTAETSGANRKAWHKKPRLASMKERKAAAEYEAVAGRAGPMVWWMFFPCSLCRPRRK